MREDTIHLLEDCTAGIEMAVSTMDGLLQDIHDRALRQKLRESLRDHQQLRSRTVSLLREYGAQAKAPNPVAKSMAWLKANARMALGGDDTTAAYLVADGCDMGVKSLCRSRNRYAMANRSAVELAQELIRCEEQLSAGLRPFF